MPSSSSPAAASQAATPAGEIAFEIEVDAGPAAGGPTRVSALLQQPGAPARAAFVFAHGAGVGMTHPFMAAVAQGLVERGIACLRFQFPSMQAGLRRPDSPAVAQATVRAAVIAAGERLPGLGLVAGGKSFGGRMSSQAQAASPLPGVRGLAFLGFPLHPAGEPGEQRAEHLGRVELPMLFLQGSRDALAELERMRAVAGRLGPLATLHCFEGADHSFHVPAKSGRSDDDVRVELLDALAAWISERCR